MKQRVLSSAVVLFLTLFNLQIIAGTPEPVLSIGEADNDTREFLHAPDHYDQFNEDSLFSLGRSSSGSDWSYVHPGPEDKWAGSREHTFSIVFGLNKAVAKEETLRLLIDTVDAHHIHPPSIQVSVNGQTLGTSSLSKSEDDESVKGDLSHAEEHILTFDLPGNALNEQLNCLQITNISGSWFLYDHLSIQGPASLSATSPPKNEFAGIMSASVDPRILSSKNGPVQNATLQLFNHTNNSTLRIRVANRAHTFKIENGRKTVNLPLPVSNRKRTVKLHLINGDRHIQTRTITQPPGREMRPVDWVDPLAGTGQSRWMLFPGSARPFGMVKLSPNSQPGKIQDFRFFKVGYLYHSEQIYGFDHLRSWTMSGLLTAPTTGELNVKSTEHVSSFNHDTEEASPGYYAVTLDRYDIRAELTSTMRTGFQRYTFPEADQARILFDLHPPAQYPSRVVDAKVQPVNNHEIEGYVEVYAPETYTQPNEYKLHFVARMNREYESFGGWNQDGIKRSAEKITGKGQGVSPVGAFIEFSTEEEEVIKLKTGISFVSIESARNNLKQESAPFGWDFDAARKDSRTEWSDLLSKIEVRSTDPTVLEKFYTNMYRSYVSRTNMSDANGKYRDMYENVQHADTPVYSSDAFWNTFWNINQLWTLATPHYMENWIKSLLEMYDVGGWLPVGPAGIEYTRVMVASHSIPFIVGAYNHGIRNFDLEKAFQAMEKHQTTPYTKHPSGGAVGNRDLEAYIKYGYVPVDYSLKEADHHDSAHYGLTSNTAEYAYDDWCLAQYAKELGKSDRYEYYRARSGNWKNSFDPETKFLRPRGVNGDWKSFKPKQQNRQRYAEGNAAQYTWFVPHDVRGLVEALGQETFVNRLNQYFEEARKYDFQDRNLGVNHGNQPTMHVAYLFNYAGKPWLTQKWARAIMDQYYGTGPDDAYPGQEDQGQMGAWYVMSALGLFQVDGGCRPKPIYQIGSPVVDRAVVDLDSNYYTGDRFVLETYNNSNENLYIQSAKFNGKELHKPFIRAKKVLQGGKLELWMGPEPNKDWGTAPDQIPPSAISDE